MKFLLPNDMRSGNLCFVNIEFVVNIVDYAFNFAWLVNIQILGLISMKVKFYTALI